MGGRGLRGWDVEGGVTGVLDSLEEGFAADARFSASQEGGLFCNVGRSNCTWFESPVACKASAFRGEAAADCENLRLKVRRPTSPPAALLLIQGIIYDKKHRARRQAAENYF